MNWIYIYIACGMSSHTWRKEEGAKPELVGTYLYGLTFKPFKRTMSIKLCDAERAAGYRLL